VSLVSSLAIFFIIWWIVLFAILPIGVVTQEESGDVTPGTEASAPGKPQLLRKALLTTVIAAVVFAGVYWLKVHSGLTLDDLPFKPPSG
jgi:predicted secreted protein